MREYLNITNECNLELMKRYDDNHFDLAIVDPPYGYGNKKTDILNFRQKEQHGEWNIAPTEEYFKELFRVSKDQIIWGGNYFPFIWNYGGRCFVYWHKGNPVENFADGELAWTSFDKNAKQFDYRYYGNLEGKTSTSTKFHPTQKPIALYQWLMQTFAKEGYKILDTHLGSGSIAIALDSLNKIEKMNLTLTACEIDEKYFKSATSRIENETKWNSLF
jgi:site-specific DNA-methyltransferase (adenine-specific)